MDQMKLSVVIPLYNDAGIVEECIRSVRAALEGIPGAECAGWEIVFVDDGSADGTLQKLLPLAADDPRVIREVDLLRLRRRTEEARDLVIALLIGLRGECHIA